MHRYSFTVTSLLLSAALLTACGGDSQTSTSTDETPAGPATTAQTDTGTADATAAPASATRDDVAEAVRCHLRLSGAIARQVSAQSTETRRYGPSVRYWHGQIGARAQAAGLTEDEADALRREVIQASQNLSATAEDNAAEVEACYAQTPPGAQ